MSKTFKPAFEIYGANGSPYSCKMRSYMRYKQIPFLWEKMQTIQGKSERDATGWPKIFSHIKGKVIPVMKFPDGTYMNDSTFLIEEIEKQGYNSHRVALPEDPQMSFLSYLIEDFGDEWITKCMYGYRWNKNRDARWSSDLLSIDGTSSLNKEPARQKMADFIQDKQTGRTAIVGCNQETIEKTMDSVCSIMEGYFNGNTTRHGLLGHALTPADFAFYGQMSQWQVDLEIAEQLPTKYQKVWAWIWRMDDMSFVPNTDQANAWFDIYNGNAPEHIKSLLRLIGDVYLPFLMANAKALQEGAESFTVNIFNGSITHTQRPFPYQGKCLNWLVEKYESIPNSPKKAQLDALLQETGCLTYFTQLASKVNNKRKLVQSKI